MKNLISSYKTVLLLAIFIVGVGTFSSSLVISGLQNYWTQTCNIYPDAGFFCANNSQIADRLLTGVLTFGLGVLLLVNWLKLLSTKRLLLAAITNTILSLLLIVFWHHHLQQVNLSGEDFLNSWYAFHFNWSGPFLAALISSLWIVPPVRKLAKSKKKK